MSAGKIDRRIQLLAQERVADGAGGWTEEWEAWGTLWAMYRPLSARERREAMALNLEIVAKIRVRYRADLPIPVRFVYGDRVLGSVGPWVEVDDRRKWVEYDVEESQMPVLAEAES